MWEKILVVYNKSHCRSQIQKHMMFLSMGKNHSSCCWATLLTDLWQYIMTNTSSVHEDIIRWKYFPGYRPFVRRIHRSPVNAPHKGQWRRTLIFSLICAWTDGWVTVETLVIWDAIVLIMTSLQCRQGRHYIYKYILFRDWVRHVEGVPALYNKLLRHLKSPTKPYITDPVTRKVSVASQPVLYEHAFILLPNLHYTAFSCVQCTRQ